MQHLNFRVTFFQGWGGFSSDTEVVGSIPGLCRAQGVPEPFTDTHTHTDVCLYIKGFGFLCII